MTIEKFEHGNREYEIRLISFGESAYYRVFRDNRPANRFRYTATAAAYIGMFMFLRDNPEKHLIDMARQDVMSGLN